MWDAEDKRIRKLQKRHLVNQDAKDLKIKNPCGGGHVCKRRLRLKGSFKSLTLVYKW